MVAFSDLDLTDLQPLSGGVSGATVSRARWSGREVVIKRTSRSELAVLQLFAELDEPVLPSLLASGIDDDGPWVVIPFHTGQPVDIMGELPDVVHQTMGRLHARFAGRTTELEDDLEVIDRRFVERGLTEFGFDHLQRARDLLDESVFARAAALLARLSEDPMFCGSVDQFTPTLLHGDLYGLNVMRPVCAGGLPLIIDWNAARIGPAMFDVAMTSAYDSPARLAHDHGWADITGTAPDARENELAHAWSSVLINAMFAGVVAARSSASDAARMLGTAERDLERFNQLRAGQRQGAGDDAGGWPPPRFSTRKSTCGWWAGNGDFRRLDDITNPEPGGPRCQPKPSSPS